MDRVAVLRWFCNRIPGAWSFVRSVCPGVALAVCCACAPVRQDPVDHADPSAKADAIAAVSVPGDAASADTAVATAGGDCSSGCTGQGGKLVCNPVSAKCVQCLIASDCVGEQVCIDQHCMPPVGCNTDLECAAFAGVCVGGQCADCHTAADCPEKMACKSGQCVPSDMPCHTEGECSGDRPACAVVQGECVQCTASSQCPISTFCSEFKCKPDVCPAGQGKCANLDDITICQGDGGSWQTLPCGYGHACIQDHCVVQVCSFGQTTCAGGELLICDPTGTVYNLVDDCGSQNLVCTQAGCVPIVCNPGSSGCTGTQPWWCSSDGVDLTLGSDCTDIGAMCQNGVCVQPICTPSLVECAGSVVVACSWDGGAQVTVKDCAATGHVCVDGQCADCVPGKAQCQGITAVICTMAGTWAMVEDCGAQDKACQAGACL